MPHLKNSYCSDAEESGQTSPQRFYDNQDITDRLGVYDILRAENEMTHTQKSPLRAFLERISKQNFLERRTKNKNQGMHIDYVSMEGEAAFQRH